MAESWAARADGCAQIILIRALLRRHTYRQCAGQELQQAVAGAHPGLSTTGTTTLVLAGRALAPVFSRDPIVEVLSRRGPSRSWTAAGSNRDWLRRSGTMIAAPGAPPARRRALRAGAG